MVKSVLFQNVGFVMWPLPTGLNGLKSLFFLLIFSKCKFCLCGHSRKLWVKVIIFFKK